MSFIYLASPYVNPADPSDGQRRLDNYRLVAQATAAALCKGYIILSPICHSHHLAMEHGLPKIFKFWRRIDTALIDSCSELWVLTIAGWSESEGVLAEIEHAKKCKKKVRKITLKELLELPEV